MQFVVVHGSYLGAWAWDLVRPELERLGHTVAAVDLPISDPTAGAVEYASIVIGAADWEEPTILVGHSMAGLVVPLVASQVPVRKLIFVAGYLPRPGMSVMDQRSEAPIDARWRAATSEWTDLGDGVWNVGPATARELFFHDAPLDVATAAQRRLRPQSYRVITEPTPLTEWPAVESRYIVLRDDRIMNPGWGRQASREHLGVQPDELDGGHCPLLSRPIPLARLIAELAA